MKKSGEVLGNERVARLWVRARTFKEADAWIDFVDAIHALFDVGKMTQARIDAIMRRVPVEGVLDFLQDVEHAASVRSLDHPDGDQAFSQLFVIPFLGDLDAIEREASRREIVDAIARGLRSTGHSPPESTVIIHPGLLSLPDLASIDILDTHEVSKESIGLLSGTSSATPRMEAIVARAAPRKSPRGELKAATRFLIGARLAKQNADVFDDGLLSRGDDVESLKSRDLRESAWHAMVKDLPDLGKYVAIHSPVPWKEARATLLYLHTWQSMTLALPSKELGSEEGKLSVGVAFEPGSLHLDIYRHDRKVARLSFSESVVGSALKDFLYLVETEIGPIVTNDAGRMTST
jgi:hypothetical protein